MVPLGRLKRRAWRTSRGEVTATQRKHPPIRWEIAARISKVLPQVRGRFRLVDGISGPHRADVKIDVHLDPDLTFEADLNTSAHLFFLQHIPPSLAPLFDRVLRPGDVVIDVGANEGIYACYAARKVGATGRVVAMEPVPATVERLRRNVERNGLADVVEIRAEACGAEPGTVTIWMPDAGHHALASAARMDASSPVEAEVSTLDAAAAGRAIRLVKIDVEGYEPAVIAGASELLNSPEPPVLVLEVIESLLTRLGHTAGDILGPLYMAGYECYSLARRGLVPCSTAGLKAPNVVALHKVTHASVLQDLRSVRWPMDQTY